MGNKQWAMGAFFLLQNQWRLIEEVYSMKAAAVGGDANGSNPPSRNDIK
jgi:hypothetical protein